MKNMKREKEYNRLLNFQHFVHNNYRKLIFCSSLHCRKFCSFQRWNGLWMVDCRKYRERRKACWAAENACWLWTETVFSFALHSFT